MSQPKPSTLTLTRRSMLTGTAASAAVAGIGMSIAGPASAAMPVSGMETAAVKVQNGVCASHHRELANHLKGILNSAYVDERMRNTVLRTTSCPHCRVAIAPDMMDRAAFSIL